MSDTMKKKKQFNARIDAELDRQVRIQAATEGRKLQGVAEQALRMWLEERKGKGVK
jgi:predicted HicB family RNase H-like nuclease